MKTEEIKKLILDSKLLDSDEEKRVWTQEVLPALSEEKIEELTNILMQAQGLEKKAQEERLENLKSKLAEVKKVEKEVNKIIREESEKLERKQDNEELKKIERQLNQK